MSRISEPFGTTPRTGGGIALTPGVSKGAPGDDVPVMRVEDEGASHDLAVPAGEPEAVGTPSEVGAHHRGAAPGMTSILWWSSDISLCLRIASSLPACADVSGRNEDQFSGPLRTERRVAKPSPLS